MASRRVSLKPVFYPPWIGIPPPSTLTPSQAKHLYDRKQGVLRTLLPSYETIEKPDIRTVAFYLDAITALMPQTQNSPVQIGLEPIIAAAIPVIGPFIGAIAGLYIVLLSLLFGISWDQVGRMLVNIALDMGAGFVPILGNIVDVAFKSNLANLGILESHLRRTPKYAYLAIPPPKSWWQAWMGRGTADW